MEVARPVRRAGRRNPPIERRQGAPVRPLHPHTHRRGLAVPGGSARCGQPPAARLRHEQPHRHPLGAGRPRHGQRHPRRPTAGIVFHSDHGSQYLAGKLRSTANGWGLAQSVGRVGSSADNAVVEAFFSSLKREPVNRRRYPDRATARRSIFEWLARYNTRHHTSLGCLPSEAHRCPAVAWSSFSKRALRGLLSSATATAATRPTAAAVDPT